MPNWVFNYLTIEGDSQSIAKVKQQLGKPFTVAIENRDMGDINAHGYPTKVKQVEYSNPVFAFHNIINYKDMGITDEEYACQPTRSELEVNDPNWWADTERLRVIDKSWYSWNITNWGTKWDVAIANDDKYSDTEITMDSADTIGYRFNTAWDSPNPVIVKLSEQYPDLNITLSYEEETGWGGETEYLAGDIISHSNYGWKCRECDHEEDDTPYCEECDFDTCPECGYNEADEACEKHSEGHNAHLLN